MKNKSFRKLKYVSGKPPECRILHHLSYSFWGPWRPPVQWPQFFSPRYARRSPPTFSKYSYSWKCWKPCIIVSGEVACVPIFTDLSERVDFMKKIIIICTIYICDSHLLMIIISCLILAYSTIPECMIYLWFSYGVHLHVY